MGAGQKRAMNPYNWQGHHPEVEVPRSGVDAVTETLLHGGGAVVLGGRGMGKSVFLRQVKAKLEGTPDLAVLLISGPPMELSAQACLDQLAEALGVSAAGALGSRRILDAYFAGDVPERLVLLFDEFDRYAESRGPASPNPPGRAFFNDLELTRRDLPGLGVLATGSLAVFTFRDTLGSSFLSRADRVLLRAFDRGELDLLARPLLERREPWRPEVLDLLYLASGGHPALATYGLGALWESPSPTEQEVADVFLDFQDKNRDFLLDFELSFADPRLSEAPQRVWELIRKSGGTVERRDLEEALKVSDSLRLDVGDVLDLLQAAGLVRVEGSKRTDPVMVSPITSILSLPQVPSSGVGIRQRLRDDLLLLLVRLHTASADFFRPGPGGEGKRLVPESVFAGFLALGFELLGWDAVREAQRVSGRTDLRLRRNGSHEVAVVEVKIWGHPGYRGVQRQIESYSSADTTAAAVVMLTDREIPDWPATYRRECLVDVESHAEPTSSEASSAEGVWSLAARTDGSALEIDHFLLRLPRGRPRAR
jgi:hypothetical protein